MESQPLYPAPFHFDAADKERPLDDADCTALPIPSSSAACAAAPLTTRGCAGSSSSNDPIVVVVQQPPAEENKSSIGSCCCAPFRPIIYTIALYILVFESFFSVAFCYLAGTFFFSGVALLPFCLVGLPFMYVGLFLARLGAKFAAYCFSAAGAEVPSIPLLPPSPHFLSRTHTSRWCNSASPFWRMFRSGTSWRSFLFILIIRPLVSVVVVMVLLVLVIFACGGLVAPFVVAGVAAEGVGSHWTWPVAVISFILGLCLLHLTLMAFVGASSFMAALLRCCVGDGDGQDAALTPLLHGTPLLYTTAAVQEDESRPEGAALSAKSVGLISGAKDEAVRVVHAVLVPTAPRRGTTLGQLCGSCVGVVTCLTFFLFLVSLGIGVVFAGVFLVNCSDRTTLIDQAVYFYPPSASDGVAGLQGEIRAAVTGGLWGEIRFTNDTSVIGTNATLVTDVNKTGGAGAVPAGAIGVRVTGKAFGGLDRFLSHFTTNIAPPTFSTLTPSPLSMPNDDAVVTTAAAAAAAATAGNGVAATIGGSDFSWGGQWNSGRVWSNLEQWLMCPSARIIVAVPPALEESLETVALNASVSVGVITDHKLMQNGSIRGNANGYGNVTILVVNFGWIDLHSFEPLAGSLNTLSAPAVRVKHLQFPPADALPTTVNIPGDDVFVHEVEELFAGTVSVTGEDAEVEEIDQEDERVWTWVSWTEWNVTAIGSVNGSAPHTLTLTAPGGSATIGSI